MSAQFTIQDRADGHFEIMVSRQTLVGVFADRDVAEKVMVFLADDEPVEVPVAPAVHSRVGPEDLAGPIDDLASVEESTVSDRKRTHRDTRPKADGGIMSEFHAPTVVKHTPRPPVHCDLRLPKLTDAQKEEAFSRIRNGEKVSKVAPDFGVSMGQLRGMWAKECRDIQKHVAEGGQKSCSTCSTMFMPSQSSPDHCARCRHDQ